MNITIEQFNKVKHEVKSKRDDLEKQMTDYGRQWIADNYGVDLTHTIRVNARIKNSAGRMIVALDRETGEATSIQAIEIGESMIINYLLTGDLKKLIGVIQHELVHYALFKLGLPYDDSDDYFIQECSKRDIPLVIEDIVEVGHVYTCEYSHKHVRARRLDVNRRICSCGGSFVGYDQVVMRR